jgi:hypothetical protein
MCFFRNFHPWIVVAALLTACSQPSNALQTTPSAGSRLPNMTSTQSPSGGAAQSSLPTLEPSSTENPPQATGAPGGLNPAGPYAVFAGDQGIWIANPDGSFPTRISEPGLGKGGQDLRSAISPDGKTLAMTATGKTGLDLVLVEIPGGKTKTVFRLIDITRRELSLNSVTPKAFAYYAITDFPSLAWQPGGEGGLAFVAAGEGGMADLFTYDVAHEKTRHIEEDASQAISPIWSPDGGYLLFFGVNWKPPYGATYITFQPMAGFWAVQASDNRILPQGMPTGTYRNFLGWRDDTHYLIFDSTKDCPAKNLRSVDLRTGEALTIAEYCLNTVPAWSPTSGAILLSVGPECGCDIGEGVFLLTADSSAPVRLLEKEAFDIDWLPESGVFYAFPEALFSADGRQRYDPPVRGSSFRPAVSKTGNQAWVVIENHRSRVVARTPGADWRTVLKGGVSAMLWDPIAGETLLMVLDTGLIETAVAPDFTPLQAGVLGGYFDQATWTAVP